MHNDTTCQITALTLGQGYHDIKSLFANKEKQCVFCFYRTMLSMHEALKPGVPHLSLSLFLVFVLLSYWSPCWTGQDFS